MAGIHIHWKNFLGHFYEHFKEVKYIPNFNGQFELDGKTYRVSFRVQEMEK